MDRPLKERLVGATILVVMGVLLIPWALDGKSRNQVNYQNQELTLPGSNEQNMETRTISLDASTPGGSTAPLEPDTQSQGRSVTTKPAGNLPVASLGSKNSDAQKQESAQQPVATTANTSDQPAEMAAASVHSENVRAEANKTAKELKASSSRPPATFADTPAPTPAATVSSNTTRSQSAGGAPAATTAPTGGDTSSQWAVQVGAFAKQENAERLAERLRDKDYKAFVMRNVVEGRVRYRVRVGPVAQRVQADLLATALREDRQPAKVLVHP